MGDAVHAVGADEVDRRVQQLGAAVADLDATVEALGSWIEEQVSPEGSFAILAQYQLQLEAARRPEAREILAEWKAQTNELAETAMASLGARDVRTAAILLICAIDGLRLRLLASGHDPLEGDALRHVLRALLAGLIDADGACGPQ